MANALASTRLKLLAALPEAAQQDAQRVAARFHLDPVAWFQGAEAQRHLPELAGAVWSGHMLRLRYDSWKGVVERRVAPLSLVLKAGIWYWVAAVGAQPRTDRASTIETLVVEDSAAAALPRFDLVRYWGRFTHDYEARMQERRARVRARPAALRRLAELSHAMAQAVAAAGPCNRAGWQVLEIHIESVDAAVGELLRLGPDVQALAPLELRRALRRAVVALQAVYGGAKGRHAVSR